MLLLPPAANRKQQLLPYPQQSLHTRSADAAHPAAADKMLIRLGRLLLLPLLLQFGCLPPFGCVPASMRCAVSAGAAGRKLSAFARLEGHPIWLLCYSSFKRTHKVLEW